MKITQKQHFTRHLSGERRYRGSLEDDHRELVLRIECGLDDDSGTRGDGSDDQTVMPLALETFKAFWGTDQVDSFKELVGEVDCGDY
jgi:hypothetical protein